MLVFDILYVAVLAIFAITAIRIAADKNTTKDVKKRELDTALGLLLIVYLIVILTHVIVAVHGALGAIDVPSPLPELFPTPTPTPA
jgi:heme/copper-type cytochrome/quinol oxidase subunit 2